MTILLTKILRVLVMGATTGVALLFVCRDLLREPARVWVAAAGVGMVLGITLELANARLAAANEAAAPEG